MLGLARWIPEDLMIISGEVGSTKPDPGIFHTAQQRLSLPPQNLWMVGDSYTGDIEGAGKLFDRPPLKAVFRERSSRRTFTLVNVHLKSKFVFGARDRERAQQANTEKRRAQLEMLNELGTRLAGHGPLFVLGDFNDGLASDFGQVLTLPNGYSYDTRKSNLDHIVFSGIERSRLGEVKETETKIARRSAKNRERPDHDIITVEVLLP